MTRAKDISKILTDADLSGTLDVAGDLNVDNATLKVDSTNNRVGISTSSMTSKFEVAVSDNTSIQEAITIKGTQGGAYGGYLGWKDNWSGDSYTGYRGAIIADVPSANSGRLRFFTANSSTLSERMRIDATGRVMIGNTTEGVAGADELTVGNTSAGNGITIRSASNSSGALFFSDGTSGGAEYDGGFEYNHASQFMRIITAGSERMRITSAGNVGIGTSSPVSDAKLTISSDNTESNIFLERSGSGRFDVAIANTGGSLAFKGGSNQTTVAGLTEFMKIDGDTGAVTKPLQPAFSAAPSADINNITGDATTAALTDVQYTEFFDNNADFNANNEGANLRGTFTAPVTGKYYIGYTLCYSGVTSASTSGVHALVTSNRVYNNNFNPYNHANVGVNGNIVFSAIVDMDANDTAHVTLYVNGNGAKVVDILASQHKFFGMLVG